MKKDFFEMVIKELGEASPQDHAAFFKELKNYTHDRLSKEAEDLMNRSKELNSFIQDVIIGK